MFDPARASGVDGPAVERRIAFDMVKRALPAVPVILLVAGLARGAAGAWSAAFAVGIVLANLVLSALLLGWAARKSLNLLMAAALGGFALRMGAVAVGIFIVHDMGWVDLPTLAIVLLVTHLGLLAWETRYVSMSLAYPDLKPAATARTTASKGA